MIIYSAKQRDLIVKHIIITLSVTALLYMGCSKKQESTTPQANATEDLQQASANDSTVQESTTPQANATEELQQANVNDNTVIDVSGKLRCGKHTYDSKEFRDWICLDGVLRCLNKEGCHYKGQKAPMRTFVSGNEASLYCDNTKVEMTNLSGMRCLDEHIEHIERSECDPSRLLPGTTCKDNIVYCGETPFPGAFLDEWRCAKDHWICIESACWCAGENKYTGKFGTCKDGNSYCGDKMQTPPGSFPPIEGYICQTGKWTCANPEGCGTCKQFQTLNDKGKCEGKPFEPKIKRVECKNGNCPCGDGACPKGGACLTVPGKDPICMCGNYSDWYRQGCRYYAEYPMYSNKFGEFTCYSGTEGGSSSEAEVWFVKCENERGCRILGEKDVWKPDDIAMEVDAHSPDSFWYDPISVAANPKFYLVNGEPYNEALKVPEQTKCGRNTALEFKQTYAINQNREKPEDSCLIRTRCDTMPVPRSDRKNYSCDFIHSPDKPPYQCFTSIFYDLLPIGLRCNSDSGCTCNHDTCTNGQLCVDGVCRYDTLYAYYTCKNVYPHLAPDESSRIVKDENPDIELEASIGNVHIYSPSDIDFAQYGDIADKINPDQCSFADAYLIHEKLLLWDHYSTDVTNKLVTRNGTCMCGYSEVTPTNLSDYKCVQSLGYVCINPNGCSCGNAQCQSGALCLREGLCSSVVMDKGLAPEKISNDVEKWCEK